MSGFINNILARAHQRVSVLKPRPISRFEQVDGILSSLEENVSEEMHNSLSPPPSSDLVKEVQYTKKITPKPQQKYTTKDTKNDQHKPSPRQSEDSDTILSKKTDQTIIHNTHEIKKEVNHDIIREKSVNHTVNLTQNHIHNSQITSVNPVKHLKEVERVMDTKRPDTIPDTIKTEHLPIEKNGISEPINKLEPLSIRNNHFHTHEKTVIVNDRKIIVPPERDYRPLIDLHKVVGYSEFSQKNESDQLISRTRNPQKSTVSISIGSVEIHAVPPKKKTHTIKKTTQQSVMSLDEYLSQKPGGF